MDCDSPDDSEILVEPNAPPGFALEIAEPLVLVGPKVEVPDPGPLWDAPSWFELDGPDPVLLFNAKLLEMLGCTAEIKVEDPRSIWLELNKIPPVMLGGVDCVKVVELESA